MLDNDSVEVLTELMTTSVLYLILAAVGFGFFWRDLRRMLQRKREGGSWWAVLMDGRPEKKP